MRSRPVLTLIALLVAGLLAGLLPGASASAVAPSLTVTPSTDLVDGQTVSATVSDMPADIAFAALFQCPSGTTDPSGCAFVASLPSVAPPGGFSLDMGVLAVFRARTAPLVD